MKKAFILCVLFAFFLAGCGGEEPQMEKTKGQAEEVTEGEVTEGEEMAETEEAAKPISQEPIERDKNPIVVMETNLGTIEIELYWKETPKIAENFLRLVISGYYDGLTFHRIVPGFVIQGGDPEGIGTGGPGYTLPDETTTMKHDRGTLAMARGPMGNNGSQFYIALSKEKTAHLDAQKFSVFGHVIKGMDVVDKIAQVPTDERGMPKEKVVMTKVYEKTE
jgi:peptidyl-prolyl cis-trans isomerase B (cyclophilin B)